MQFIDELALSRALDGSVRRCEPEECTGVVTHIDTAEVFLTPALATTEITVDIPDALVIFPNVIVLNGQIVVDVNCGYRASELIDHGVPDYPLRRSAGGVELRLAASSAEIDACCYMVASSNYSAFLLGELPRLETYAPYMAEGMPLVLHGAVRDFHRELLALAGIEPGRVLEVGSGIELHTQRLIHTSPAFQSHNTSISAMRFLRQSLCGLGQSSGRYYLSRSGLGKNSDRLIVNELHLEEFLRSRDVEIVHPQAMSAVQQLEIFASADLVISPFGATWANAIVRKAGSRSLMLKTKFTPEFARLLALNGNDLDLLRLPPWGLKEGQTYSQAVTFAVTEATIENLARYLDERDGRAGG